MSRHKAWLDLIIQQIGDLQQAMGAWGEALVGGTCLGCASVAVLTQAGRVLGVSGIVR